MCRKPRAFWGSLAVLVANAVPVESALIAWSPVLSPASAASAGTPAVFAFIAGAVGHHEHAAFRAGWRAFVGVARSVADRISGSRCRRNRLQRNRRCRRRLGNDRAFGRSRSIEL